MQTPTATAQNNVQLFTNVAGAALTPEANAQNQSQADKHDNRSERPLPHTMELVSATKTSFFSQRERGTLNQLPQ